MKLIVLFLIIISATAWSQQNIAIKGSDTLGAKMVPKLKEVWLTEVNKAEFEIALAKSRRCKHCSTYANHRRPSRRSGARRYQGRPRARRRRNNREHQQEHQVTD